MAGLLLSAAWYGAALAQLAALIALVRPLPVRGLRTRRGTLLIFAAALATLAGLAAAPPRLAVVEHPTSHLDRIVPAFHYAERHVRHVNAGPERVFMAAKTVSAGEIRLFQTLTSIRRLGRTGPESILNAPEHMPILDVATRTGFVLLVDDPPREIVFGTVVVAPAGQRSNRKLTPDTYRSITGPGFVTATMNFRVDPEGTGSRLTTETRIRGTDSSAIREFTPYWRTILPGSWILRLTWLEAIARRAEGHR